MENQEVRILRNMIRASQPSIMATMKRFLLENYEKVHSTSAFIFAAGDIPIALVAHADTIHPKPPHMVYFDQQYKVMWSPEGLGADDRAGVFAIYKIVKSGLRPSIIITTDEEVGGIGASALIDAFPEPPALINYIIELDRQGRADCVFYTCQNKDFITYIEQFGFFEQNGSFSDISIICPYWKIAGVNLSIGYIEEHTYREMLFLSFLEESIHKVMTMLQEKEIPAFQYVAPSPSPLDNIYSLLGESADIIDCGRCKQKVFVQDTMPVKMQNGTTQNWCFDCISEADWCSICEEPFEFNPNKEHNICPSCEQTILGGASLEF